MMKTLTHKALEKKKRCTYNVLKIHLSLPKIHFDAPKMHL
jgi:hypothetical protein